MRRCAVSADAAAPRGDRRGCRPRSRCGSVRHRCEGHGRRGRSNRRCRSPGPAGCSPSAWRNLSTRIAAAAQSSRSAAGELATASSMPLTRAVQPWRSQRKADAFADLGGRAAVAVVLEPARQLEARAAARQRRQLAGIGAHRDELAAAPDQHVGTPSRRRQHQAQHDRARCRAAASACPTARTTARRRPSARTRRSGSPARGRPRPAGPRPSCAHHTIASMPHPITHSGAASRPNGIATSARQRRRHDDQVADRNGERLARIANCCVLWKW